MKYAKDSFGNRMKEYEAQHNGRLMPRIPVVARLDGKAFHTFCAGLKRPFDIRLSQLMIDTTLFLVEETNARIGYTQSDEISLVLLADFGQQLWFDRRIAKMNSVLAAMASVFFNKQLARIPERINLSPVFDCRVFNVPDRTEAVNYLIWREKDATRNSVSMAAQSHFSHRKLQGKSRSEMQEMLFSKGINWNDYPTHFKRGTYVQRQKVERPFTTAELELLPAKHHARQNPDLKVVRTDYIPLALPPLTQIQNREAVVFDGDKPNGNKED